MGAMFGGGGSNPEPERYAGIQVSTSMMGQTIPYVAGRNRVPMNLIWYGNFNSSPNHDGGKGGSPVSSYTYSASWIAALCLGPIQGVGQVWQDKSLVTLTYENLALALGSASFVAGISGTTLSVSKILGGSMYVGQYITGPGVAANTTITAGSGTSWTVSPSQTVASGTAMRGGQPTWSGYPSGTPAGQEIPYDGIAYVASQEYIFGSSANMPNLNFEVEGCVPGFSDADGVYDADPSAVVIDYLTDPVHGAAFQGTIDPNLQGTTNTYQAYCMSIGVLLSPYEDNQRSATDFMRELLQCTNSDLVMSCGMLRIVPYADQPVSGTVAGTAFSYTPDLTPIYAFTDSDFCPKDGEEPLQLDRKAPTDTYNIVNLTYYDRSNYYNPAPATADNNWDISIRGPKAMSTLDFQSVTQASVAKTVAQLILQFQLYERNTYTARVRADYCLLEPMDYVSVTEPAFGLSGQVCRVIEVEDDDNDFVNLKLMKVPGVVRSTPQYNWTASQGYYANYDAVPPSVATPAIFVMPPVPASIGNGLGEGITVGIAACPSSVSASWGWCSVWCSVDGGSTYFQVGTIGQVGPARYGTITAALPAVADPDTTSTLSILLEDTNLQLAAVTDADANAMQTLILVDSGTNAEVMAYGDATLTGAGAYNLTYLRRGLYGSNPPKAHSSGAQFVRLDGAIFQQTFDPGMAGQTVYFKFVSVNAVGQQPQELSAVTAYAYTIPQGAINGAAQLIPRGNASLTAQGELYATGGSAWSSDCVSSQPYRSLSLSAQYSSGTAAVGLVSSVPTLPATLDPATNMDFALFANLLSGSSGHWEIFESGSLVATLNPPVHGDAALLTYDGFYVRYYLNGALLRTSARDQSALYVGLALDPAASFSNVETGPLTAVTPTQWITINGCAVNDTTATRTASTATWDAGAFASIGYPTCHISGKTNHASDAWQIGLATSANVSAAAATAVGNNAIWQLANYSWINQLGTWEICEAGTVVGSYGSVALTDVAAVTYDGSTITYLLNGVSQRTVSVSGLTLFGLCALQSVGSGVNSLSFGPTTNLKVNDTAELGTNAATETYVQAFSSSAGASAGNLSSGLTIGPYPYPVTVVVTMTGSASYGGSAGSQAYFDYANSDVSGSLSGGGHTISQLVDVDSAGNSYATIAAEDTFSLAANTTTTYYLVGQRQPPTGVAGVAASGVIKCEVIKR